MRHALVSLLLLALFFMPLGCSPKPTPGPGPAPAPVIDIEKLKKDATIAGEMAAYAYLAIESPTEDQAKAVRDIVMQFQDGFNGYVEKGFVGALPEINKAIDKLLPIETKKAENLLAKKFAETTAVELDAFFKKHPDYRKIGSDSASIIAAFLGGAKTGFDKWLGMAPTLRAKPVSPPAKK